MNKIRSLLAVAFCLYLCVMVMQGMFTPFFDPRRQAVNSVFRDFSSYAKEHKLVPISTTISAPEGPVRSLGMGFQIRGPLAQSDLRKLLIDIGQQLISLVNANESIRPFLREYPFSFSNIEFHIFIVDEKNELFTSPEISCVGVRRGQIYFEKWRYEGALPRIESHVEESYDDALRL